MFEVMAIHAGDQSSFFRVWFRTNNLLLWAVVSTALLQLAVIYLPFLQATFETAPLSLLELGISVVVASVILFAVEIEKIIFREADSERLVTSAS